jgi:predicted nucleic acid-binding protein
LSRIYVDSNVFLYAIGTEHRYREPCRAFVRALAGHDELSGETSAETIQEVVHHRRRRGDTQATERGRQTADLCAAVHPFDRDTMVAALRLIDRHPMLPTRDAVHAATALAVGVTLVVSADRDFDAVTGLERIDPCDVDSLIG